MACETWRGSLRFELISESRRPRFEPDIDNVPHEFFLWQARRGGGHSGSNVSAKAAVQDSNQMMREAPFNLQEGGAGVFVTDKLFISARRRAENVQFYYMSI